MKKKVLVIQSVVMLVITLVMLSVVSFAWFVSTNKTDLAGFNVSVVGTASIKTEFFAKDNAGAYLPITPSESIPLIKNDMIPGEAVWRRIDVTNLSPSKISLRIDFTGCVSTLSKAGALPPDDKTTQDAKTELTNAFVVQVWGQYLDTEPVFEPTNEVKFLTNSFATPPINEFTLINTEVNIANNAPTPPTTNKLCIFYRFILNPNFVGIDDYTLKFNSSGIKFIANVMQ